MIRIAVVAWAAVAAQALVHTHVVGLQSDVLLGSRRPGGFYTARGSLSDGRMPEVEPRVPPCPVVAIAYSFNSNVKDHAPGAEADHLKVGQESAAETT